MSSARELDQFYTSRTASKNCFDFLARNVSLTDTDTFLEPSAGDGAFFELMPAGRRLGVDLEPKHPEVVHQNFLTEFVPHRVAGRWISAGNPPFGRNASLAVKFFNKAAEFSEVVAFVIPLTFRKQSLQKRLDPNFILVAELELPLQSFVFEGKPKAVPCCFQVWQRSTVQRKVLDLPLTHADFDFCMPEEADFAIRRVGGLAGKILRDFKGYSPKTNYFVRSKIDVEVLLARLADIDWTDTKGNVAGNPSISKRELVGKYTEKSGSGRANLIVEQGSESQPGSPVNLPSLNAASHPVPNFRCAQRRASVVDHVQRRRIGQRQRRSDRCLTRSNLRIRRGTVRLIAGEQHERIARGVTPRRWWVYRLRLGVSEAAGQLVPALELNRLEVGIDRVGTRNFNDLAYESCCQLEGLSRGVGQL